PGDDSFSLQPPVVHAARADHLLAVLVAEIAKGIVARDASDARNEQRQRRIGQVMFGGGGRHPIPIPFGSPSPTTRPCSSASSCPPSATSCFGCSPALR